MQNVRDYVSRAQYLEVMYALKKLKKFAVVQQFEWCLCVQVKMERIILFVKTSYSS